MALKQDGSLSQWVVEALEAHDGCASIVQICKHIWIHHESDLREAGDEFYTWQYDMRWAGQQLRDKGILQPKSPGDRGPWRFSVRSRF